MPRFENGDVSMRRRSGQSTLLAVAAFMILASPIYSFAQYHVNGTITVTVTDPSGAIVAGVRVTATDVATNTSQSTVTNASGVYLFSDVAPATYTVTAT